MQIKNVHRDYRQRRRRQGGGGSDYANQASRFRGQPDYVEGNYGSMEFQHDMTEGYSQRPVTVDGNPGVETFDEKGKTRHPLDMLAKRISTKIDTQTAGARRAPGVGTKRVDCKKLAAISDGGQA